MYLSPSEMHPPIITHGARQNFTGEIKSEGINYSQLKERYHSPVEKRSEVIADAGTQVKWITIDPEEEIQMGTIASEVGCRNGEHQPSLLQNVNQAKTSKIESKDRDLKRCSEISYEVNDGVLFHQKKRRLNTTETASRIASEGGDAHRSSSWQESSRPFEIVRPDSAALRLQQQASIRNDPFAKRINKDRPIFGERFNDTDSGVAYTHLLNKHHALDDVSNKTMPLKDSSVSSGRSDTDKSALANPYTGSASGNSTSFDRIKPEPPNVPENVSERKKDNAYLNMLRSLGISDSRGSELRRSMDPHSDERREQLRTQSELRLHQNQDNDFVTDTKRLPESVKANWPSIIPPHDEKAIFEDLDDSDDSNESIPQFHDFGGKKGHYLGQNPGRMIMQDKDNFEYNKHEPTFNSFPPVPLVHAKKHPTQNGYAQKETSQYSDTLNLPRKFTENERDFRRLFTDTRRAERPKPPQKPLSAIPQDLKYIGEQSQRSPIKDHSGNSWTNIAFNETFTYPRDHTRAFAFKDDSHNTPSNQLFFPESHHVASSTSVETERPIETRANGSRPQLALSQDSQPNSVRSNFSIPPNLSLHQLTLPPNLGRYPQEAQDLIVEHERLKERKRDLETIIRLFGFIAKFACFEQFTDRDRNEIQEARKFVGIVVEKRLPGKSIRKRMSDIQDNMQRRIKTAFEPTEDALQEKFKAYLGKDRLDRIVQELERLTKRIDILSEQRNRLRSRRKHKHSKQTEVNEMLKPYRKQPTTSVPGTEPGMVFTPIADATSVESHQQAYKESSKKQRPIRKERLTHEDKISRLEAQLALFSPEKLSTTQRSDIDDTLQEDMTPNQHGRDQTGCSDSDGTLSEDETGAEYAFGAVSTQFTTKDPNVGEPEVTSLAQHNGIDSAKHVSPCEYQDDQLDILQDDISHSADRDLTLRSTELPSPPLTQASIDLHQREDTDTWNKTRNEVQTTSPSTISGATSDTETESEEEEQQTFRYTIKGQFAGIEQYKDGDEYIFTKHYDLNKANKKVSSIIQSIQEYFPPENGIEYGHWNLQANCQGGLLEQTLTIDEDQRIQARVWIDRKLINNRNLSKTTKRRMKAANRGMWFVDWEQSIIGIAVDGTQKEMISIEKPKYDDDEQQPDFYTTPFLANEAAKRIYLSWYHEIHKGMNNEELRNSKSMEIDLQIERLDDWGLWSIIDEYDIIDDHDDEKNNDDEDDDDENDEKKGKLVSKKKKEKLRINVRKGKVWGPIN